MASEKVVIKAGKTFFQYVDAVNKIRVENEKDEITFNEAQSVADVILFVSSSQLNLNNDVMDLLTYFAKVEELKETIKQDVDELQDEPKGNLILFSDRVNGLIEGKQFSVVNKFLKVVNGYLELQDSETAKTLSQIKKFDKNLTALRVYDTAVNVREIMNDLARNKAQGTDFLVQTNLQDVLSSGLELTDFDEMVEKFPITDRQTTIAKMKGVVKTAQVETV